MFVRAIVLCSLCLTGSVGADVLTMPEGGADLSAQEPMIAVQLPARGMSMAQVLAAFGEPLGRRSPIGDPPITRWVYERYTIYFEHQYVIHSVLNP